jgi:hypothetical protein
MRGPGDLLDPEKIARNVRDLRERGILRFKGRAIVERADRLVALADRAIIRSRELARPRLFLRAVCLLPAGLLVALVITAACLALRTGHSMAQLEFMDLIQGTESTISCVVFLGVALFFFGSLEKRFRRNAILLEMDYLRNFLHLVNMGQLDKEPSRLESGFKKTELSPEIGMDAGDMERYLSLSQKLAYYAAEIGCVYANVLVDTDVDLTADQLREFASDIGRAASEKITILALKSLQERDRGVSDPGSENATDSTTNAQFD